MMTDSDLVKKVRECAGLQEGMQDEINMAHDSLLFYLEEGETLDSWYVRNAFGRIKNLRKKQIHPEEKIEEILKNAHHN